jgi:hypothetical protein
MTTEKEVKDQVADQLASLLPKVEIENLEVGGYYRDVQFDLVARVRVGEVERTLLVEVKSSGQPRYLRQVIAQFQETDLSDRDVYFLVAAPYITSKGMDICRQHQVGCVDLMGNVYLDFDGVYIERIAEEKPGRRKRRIKNLFAPVSSRIVRAMLEEPDQTWTLKELAHVTDASLGQTYNVSEKLVDEDLAQKSSQEGLVLTDPAGLLDLWRQAYDIQEANEMFSFHASERDPTRLMAQVERVAGRLEEQYAFTLHAGASLVAPYVRFTDVHFYVGAGVQTWIDALGLHTVEFGGNVHLLRPYDEGVFYRLRLPQGMAVVGNIQLYIDLYKYPARGKEQAEFLREKEIGF